MTYHRPMGLPTNGRKPGTMPRQRDRAVTWDGHWPINHLSSIKAPYPFGHQLPRRIFPPFRRRQSRIPIRDDSIL
ncbi:MAG: hypothetical protein CW346_06005 [Bacillaceae bacterium]|nr:hypothetical protein [Bacillaceae bacterium]